MQDYIVLAVPFFFLLIGVELVAARIKHREVYRLNDSINNLQCGISEQVVLAFVKVFFFLAYAGVYDGFAVWSIPRDSITAWLVLFFAVDFIYYWFHRFSHRVNAAWSGHIVHHQSEEFNLAVALRQGTLQPFFSFWFYLPLAVIGFPPLMYVAAKSFNTLYQFWIHTRLIDRMGPLEWVLNTPSHHRVHHGRNPEYLDKNYAGVFIIWDRMFGTFEEEKTAPAYGITTPLNSWNPIWANIHHLCDVARLCYRAPKWWDKIKVWFMPPGWIPPGVDEEPGEHAMYTRYNPRVPLGVSVYAGIQFIVVIAASMVLLNLKQSLALPGVVALAVFVFFSMVNVGALFDRKQWVRAAEWIRMPLMVSVVAILLYRTPFLIPACVAAAVIAALFALWVERLHLVKAPSQ